MMSWDSAVSWADPAKAFPRSNGRQRDLTSGVKLSTPLALDEIQHSGLQHFSEHVVQDSWNPCTVADFWEREFRC